jgi:CheY-like chemotaxis protein
MIKVLIAEDNAVNRELLRELLELRGCTVLEACDGQEALQMIEQIRPELLLLDIGMPVMDGFAVIRKIRENPGLATLPVVAVTAYAMRGDEERILSSGFDGYLSKPLNPSSLAQELESRGCGSNRQLHPLGPDLGFHFLHIRYKLSNRLLTLRANIRELDALALLICPHDSTRRVNVHSRDWQLERQPDGIFGFQAAYFHLHSSLTEVPTYPAERPGPDCADDICPNGSARRFAPVL